MAAKQINVAGQQYHNESGNDPGVQREKASESMMAIISPTDDDFLQSRPDGRDDRQKVGCHSGRPKSFLVPGQQVTGQ